jgi:hypothetical protein
LIAGASRTPDRVKKPFVKLAILVFVLVAVVHLLRLIYGWEATIAGAAVPTWASILALVISGVLAVGLWRESLK